MWVGCSVAGCCGSDQNLKAGIESKESCCKRTQALCCAHYNDSSEGWELDSGEC